MSEKLWIQKTADRSNRFDHHATALDKERR
jgi:hypothetical protein